MASVTSMRLKRANTRGWTSRITYIGRGTKVYSVSIFIDGKGLEWVRCQPREKPTHVARFENLPPVYLRQYEGSATQRRRYVTQKQRRAS